MKASTPFALPLVLATLLASHGAAAQTVYRCGSTYSQSPCPEGAAVRVDDARSGVQKRQADDATQRGARAADDMEKTRLKLEAKAEPAHVMAGRTDVPQREVKSVAMKKIKPYKPGTDDFVATDGKTNKARKKAEKEAEKAAKAKAKAQKAEKSTDAGK